jgi:septal ring factor EnvC (AmiA/AmiB activator)
MSAGATAGFGALVKRVQQGKVDSVAVQVAKAKSEPEVMRILVDRLEVLESERGKQEEGFRAGLIEMERRYQSLINEAQENLRIARSTLEEREAAWARTLAEQRSAMQELAIERQKIQQEHAECRRDMAALKQQVAHLQEVVRELGGTL